MITSWTALTRIALTSVALGLSSVACIVPQEQVDSDDVRTSGYYAEYSVAAGGDGSTLVRARLLVGGNHSNTFAEIDGEDELVVYWDQDNQIMLKRDSAPGAFYEAVLEGDAEREIRIAFERDGFNSSAPDSAVMLPKPFVPEFRDFEAGESWPRGEDVVIDFDTEDTMPMEWSLNGSCYIDTDDGPQGRGWLAARGVTSGGSSITIRAEQMTLSPHRGSDEESDEQLKQDAERSYCEAKVEMTRIRRGNVDGAFGEGGILTAMQARWLSFRSVQEADPGS